MLISTPPAPKEEPIKSELYSHTRAATAHNEQRTGERRLAVLASIRAARNLGRVWNVLAAGLGLALATLLSGFALWPPIVSSLSVITSFAVAIAVAWTGAILLPRPASGALWFSAPIALGLVFAGILRHWDAFGVLAGCMAISFCSLALYRCTCAGSHKFQ